MEMLTEDSLQRIHGILVGCTAPPRMQQPQCQGRLVFRKGNGARVMLYIGEIGVFAPDHRRTQTVACVTNVELSSETDRRNYELDYQESKLAF